MARRVLPWIFLLLLPVACGPGSPAHEDDVPVKVGMVALDKSNVPVVVLEEQGGDRILPIWIGSFEAHSIASQMEAQTPLRPNTHDLAKTLITRLHAEVLRVVVTDLREGTYYAVLSLQAGGDLLELDSRPSDAIAIALRAGAPIFVRAPVFEAAGAAGSSGEGGESGRPIHGQPLGTAEATPQLGL
jgi:bifunctional DNase/RNase